MIPMRGDSYERGLDRIFDQLDTKAKLQEKRQREEQREESRKAFKKIEYHLFCQHHKIMPDIMRLKRVCVKTFRNKPFGFDEVEAEHLANVSVIQYFDYYTENHQHS